MIAIDNILISDEVVEEQFVCDLNKCKGGCCEDGDAGAPMEKWEMKKLDEYYEVIKPYMTPEGIAEVKRGGKYVFDQEFGWVTPTINGAICAYGFKDEQGIIKCGIEQAYNDGKLDWKKPVSCRCLVCTLVPARSTTITMWWTTSRSRLAQRPPCSSSRGMISSA
jgi:hypothetical protein